MTNSVSDFFQNLFGPVVNLLGSVLQYFHYDLGLEWWVSIAALTVIVRLVLFPLTIKQVLNMRAMQDLKPEMDRIRGQFRNNRQRQQEEMMKLYRERSINPLGGCLPVVVQMPVFIGIFYVIRQFGGYGDTPGTEPSFQQGGILWFENLSEMDPYLILPVVSAATMLGASLITARNMERQQRIIILVLPVAITVFLWNFPAGLFVYWITSNVVTLGQNYAIYNVGPEWIAARKERRSAGSAEASQAPDEVETAGASSEDRATKGAKRKRRKKRK